MLKRQKVSHNQYTNHCDYINSILNNIRLHLKDHTAVDAGGPSRQFINDVFLQMQTLAVPVNGSGSDSKDGSNKSGSCQRIALFCQEEAGEKRGRVIELVPKRDDELERVVRKILCERRKETDSPEIEVLILQTKTRIQEYSRAMGRILLHAIICGYPVLSSCMTPFYRNCKNVCFHMIDSGLALSNSFVLLQYFFEESSPVIEVIVEEMW